MTYKELKLKIKEEQKERAASIRILKAARKPHVYNSNPGLYNALGNLDRLRYAYRHIHIQYCMFFNKTKYTDIEKECLESPSTHNLDSIKKEWEKEVDDVETVRVNS